MNNIEYIQSFSKLKNNWDSYDGIPPNSNCIKNSIQFYKRVSSIGIEPNLINPIPTGGIGFIFDSNVYEYIIEIKNDNKVIEYVLKHFDLEYFSIEMTGINENFTFGLIVENIRQMLLLKK